MLRGRCLSGLEDTSNRLHPFSLLFLLVLGLKVGPLRQLLLVYRDLPDGMIYDIQLTLGAPLVIPSEFVAHLQILALSLSDTFLDGFNEDEGPLLGILGFNPHAI